MKIMYQIIDWSKQQSSFVFSSLREADERIPSQGFPGTRGSQTWLIEGCSVGPSESFQTRNDPRIKLQTGHVK